MLVNLIFCILKRSSENRVSFLTMLESPLQKVPTSILLLRVLRDSVVIYCEKCDLILHPVRCPLSPIRFPFHVPSFPKLPIVLAMLMIVLLIVLTVGWVLLTVSGALQGDRHSGLYWALLTIGSIFIALLLAGVVLYLILSIKAINLTRRQSNFIDSVTHELKSPIASMKLYLQTLEPPSGEPAGAGRFPPLHARRPGTARPPDQPDARRRPARTPSAPRGRG